MKNSVFVSFCLMLLTGILALHMVFQQAMSPVSHLQSRIEALEKQKSEAEFRAQLAAFQIADYQQHVATLLPSALKGMPYEAAYPLRQLASVSGADGKELVIERASGLFEHAKEAFRRKEYAKSNETLEAMIDRYPASIHAAEAHFLLAEGQFQARDYEGAVATIEKLIDVYPENELTGFALLRLGSIFEKQERLEDAADVYRAVLVNFRQPSLLEQAKVSLQAVAL